MKMKKGNANGNADFSRVMDEREEEGNGRDIFNEWTMMGVYMGGFGG